MRLICKNYKKSSETHIFLLFFKTYMNILLKKWPALERPRVNLPRARILFVSKHGTSAVLGTK